LLAQGLVWRRDAGGFDPEVSDIDLIAVLSDDPSQLMA
jgi:hypothetical protein